VKPFLIVHLKVFHFALKCWENEWNPFGKGPSAYFDDETDEDAMASKGSSAYFGDGNVTDIV
jgi:hypothetical protein